MNQFRALQYRSDKANRKLSDMIEHGIIQVVNDSPHNPRSYPHWHKIEHMHMGIPIKPEFKQHIEQAKNYTNRFHKHVNFLLAKPLPKDLTYDELNEIQDALYDASDDLEFEVGVIYDAKEYDSDSWPLVLTSNEVKDPENELGKERANYVQVLHTALRTLCTRKQNINKNKMVDRLVVIHERYKQVNSVITDVVAMMEWMEKGDRE